MGDTIDAMDEEMFGRDKKPPKAEAEQIFEPGQIDLIKQITEFMQGQLGKGVEAYGGPRVAGAGDLLSSVFQQAQGWTEYDPESAREYWQEAFVDPAMQQWEDVTAPGIFERFAAYGAADSGATRRAIAKGQADLQTGLHGKLADILYQEKQDQVGRTMQAAELGGLERGIRQEGLSAAQSKWAEEQGYNNPWIDKYMQYALTPTKSVVGLPEFQETGLWGSFWGK